ncbi:copper homeostasis protein CutC [Allofournierella sp.]|uniref:copper homeostasis protein CutC n=1 Tax=Allofournierella sp. TaxID=1940256 RepID=UPI003AB16DC8
MSHFLLECCVDSPESALAAAQNGADRLELCADLLVGGITPSSGLFELVKRQVKIPVNVLLRPRFGDFCYTGLEFEVLLADAARFAAAGAGGLVLGVLTPEGELDLPRMRRLIAAARGLPVTLHRAFDVCRDPFAALRAAKALGVSSILTSGQAAAAPQGTDLLAQLVRQAGPVNILVGGGVNSGNLAALAAATGAKHFHMSGKRQLESPMHYRKEGVPMGLPLASEFSLWRTDGREVAAARAALDRLSAAGEALS